MTMKAVHVIFIFIFVLLVSCNESDDCEQDSRCELEPDVGPCDAAFPKYYYDQEEKKCKEFTWGGCEGVVPFDTLEACEEDCGCEAER